MAVQVHLEFHQKQKVRYTINLVISHVHIHTYVRIKVNIHVRIYVVRTYASYLMTLAQSSSSEVSGCGNKISATIFGSEIAGGDYLSTTLEGQLSKEKVEVLGTYALWNHFENPLS